jgi:hypothetical protein
VFIGDSLTEGTDQSGGPPNSWIWKLSSMCGWQDVWNDGHGSTGPIADRDGKSTNYRDTISQQAAPVSPTIVFITSYWNDRSKGPALIAEAFDNAIDTAQSLPSHPLVVVTGTYDPLGINGSPYQEIDASLTEVCNRRGVPYVEPRTGNIYAADGRVITTDGPWVTTENRDSVISPDGRHQSAQGQAYMAQRMFDAIEALN